MRLLSAGFSGSATDNGTATTIVDTKWKGAADDANGMWAHITATNNSGEIVRVTDDDGSGTLTVDALSSASTSGDTYLLWQEAFRPEVVHEMMDMAIMGVQGRWYDPEEDITLHGDGKQNRFSLPASFAMVKKVEYRSTYSRIVIHDASSAWTAGTNVTATADTELKKQGTASNKLVIAAGASAGDVVAYKDFTADDFSDMTHVEWWARCSAATTAADFKLLLDDTSACVSPIELLDFPALTADTWTFCRVALAKADEDTAIASVGVELDQDATASLWIDHVQATKDSEDLWTRIPPNLWYIDQEAGEIVFRDAAISLIGYRLIKLTGGDEPALLTANSSVTEVPEDYLVAKTCALVAAQASTAVNDKWATLAGFWEAQANRAYRRMPMLVDARRVT